MCDTIVMTLAKKQYWGGNPELIYKAPTEIVMNALNYEQFTGEYQETEMLINEVNNG